MNTKIIPSIFTLSNLLLGVLSLVYTMEEEYQLASIMILVAMILDGMDGKVARRLDATSPFGKELDSLCDLVSFGVAPAILVYSFKLSEFGLTGLAIALAFTLCGAIRLARFNTMTITTHFVGVPITAAGSLLAILALLGTKIPLFIFPIVVVLFSYLMVSNIKIPKY